MVDSDSVLVESARRGEAAAFEALVHRFQGRVRGFFATRLADASLVDDLAQETFLIAYRKLGTFDPALPFYPWLKGIAQNFLQNELRKHRPRVEDPRTLSAVLDRAAAAEADRLERREPEAELSQALRDCLERMGAAASRLVEARYRQALPLEEIARREGKSLKALSVTLVRIRQRLRECLDGRLARSSLAGGGTE